MSPPLRPALAVDRDAYLREALPYLPSLLQLLDRNPVSRTFGCFDRSYWHFRTMDFPCGMSQEFVLPLALAWKHEFSGNPFHGAPRLREWVLAGIDFARRSAHSDASCDDYYPFERALGATVYSLYAMAEAYRIVAAKDPALLDFLARRARWVAAHGETGVLTNHHAIAANALQIVSVLSGDESLGRAAARKAQEVLGNQHEEGWFREYEGFDVGYQTVTVDFLARYWRESGDASVFPGLERAVRLLELVQHPDGSFGGEYAARNTYHAQPHGLELLAPSVPAARRVADRLLRAFSLDRRARNDDDRLLGHHVYPCLQAWLDFAPRTEPTPAEPPAARDLLPACGLLVDRSAEGFLVAGLKKGAPFRVYVKDRLVANDSGPVLVLEDGRVLVTHRSHDAQVTDDGTTASASGRFQEAKGELMTPMKSVLLRALMLTIGRVARNFVRKLLQKRLILGTAAAPFAYERRLTRTPGGFSIVDRIRSDPGAAKVARAYLGVGQTSIYIAVSQPFEPGWLLPWTDLQDRVAELNDRGEIEMRRDFRTRDLDHASVRT